MPERLDSSVECFNKMVDLFRRMIEGSIVTVDFLNNMLVGRHQEFLRYKWGSSVGVDGFFIFF